MINNITKTSKNNYKQPTVLKTIKKERLLSNRIKYYLNQKGMSQKELAESIEYDLAHLSRIANGKLKNLTYTTVIDIAKGIGVPASKLFIYKPIKKTK